MFNFKKCMMFEQNHLLVGIFLKYTINACDLHKLYVIDKYDM